MSEKQLSKPRNANGTFAYCKELTPIQQEAICELIQTPNKSEVCKKLEISRACLYRWLDDEKFLTAYTKACEAIYKDAMSDALKNIVSLANCEDKRTALKACETILKLNGMLRTDVDIDSKNQEIVITLSDN